MDFLISYIIAPEMAYVLDVALFQDNYETIKIIERGNEVEPDYQI